ncbi:hypothetical protein BASA81_002420 [Batrachochytrium salamandrivorans]|nr:hypothetical protein BASA81_002420 [Batrachochytrium salamandrivorans]
MATTTSAWLEEFNANPGRVEELFARAEGVDSGLAMELTLYSSPASRHRNELRFLALKFLQGAVSRRWRAPAASTRRPPSGSEASLVLEEPAKAQILHQLLGDVASEAVQFLAQKRAQIIAEICRFDSTRWNKVFQVLTTTIPTTLTEEERQPCESRLLFCLHVVIKELSGLRIGTHVLEFTKASKTLFEVLARRLEVLRMEVMVDESGAEVCCLVVKSMNCLLAGAAEIDSLLVSLQFELAYKVLLTTVNTVVMGKWKSKLDKQLRKVPLIAIKTHLAWFQQQPYYTSFVSCTLALLGVSDGNDNQLCAFRFWTLLVSQRASLDVNQVQVAMQSALAGLRLTLQQVEQWKVEGGERFCNEEADSVFDTKLTGDGTLRTCAKRFLQTCVDQMNGKTGGFTQMLQHETPRSELEWESWLFALELDPSFGTRLEEAGFHTKVLNCLSPYSPSPERAMLTRRALCVLQHAHPVTDYYSVLGNVLANAKVEDLGVLLQAIELYIAIISHSSQLQTFSLPMLAKHLSIPQIVIVWHRFEMVESKVRIIDLFSAIVLGASSPLLMDPASLAFVMDEFVPFALREPGLQEVTRNPLICSAVLGLVQACVQCIGFSHLQSKSQQVCGDLIQHCAEMHDLHLLDWPVVLLSCLQTCTTSKPEILLPVVSPTVLARVGDVSVRCKLLESIALLSLDGDYSSVVVTPLWESVLEPKPATVASGTDKKSLFPRTAPDAPFILYDVCHCLGMLVHCNNLVPLEFWLGVLNSPTAMGAVQTGDVRDAIELVTLRSQVILYKRAFFTEIGAAREFALLCAKYFDATGYVPKHVVWRNRLWVYVLLYIVAKCSSVQEIQCFMPSLVECCSKLVSQGNSRPMHAIASCSNNRHGNVNTAHDLRVLAVLATLDKADFDELFKASWVRLETKFSAQELEIVKSPKLQVLLL